MASLSSKLRNRCREILLQCEEFDSHENLKTSFNVAELAAYKDDLPEAATKRQRVDRTMTYLMERKLKTGQPLLLAFMKVLITSYSEEDNRYWDLKALLDDFDKEVNPANPLSPSPQIERPESAISPAPEERLKPKPKSSRINSIPSTPPKLTTKNNATARSPRKKFASPSTVKNNRDPQSSPMGRKLLEYKGVLRQVLRQLPTPDPTRIHRRDIETLIQDLEQVLGGIASLANRTGIEQFLFSREALKSSILDAKGRLYVALFAYENIKAVDVKVEDKTKSIWELNTTLSECQRLLRVALNQFRI